MPDSQQHLVSADPPLSRVGRTLERIVGAAALAAGYILILQAVFTAVEVIARKLFNYSFQGIDEIGGYALAITASLGFGFATLHRTHTRVDILLQRLPLALQGWLHLLAILVLFAIAAMMVYFGALALGETLEYGSIANSPLQTPLWIPQTLWLAGLCVFALCAGVIAARALRLVLSGRFAALDAEMRPPSLDEEIEASLQ